MENIELPEINESKMIIPKIIIEIENDTFNRIISEIPLEVYIKVNGKILEDTVDVIYNMFLVQKEVNTQ